MKKFTSLMVAAAFGLGMSGPAFADVGAQTHGMTYGEWGAAWYQWQDENFPGFSSGDDCALGQSGPVWFLGGSGGTTESRTCEDPVKKNRHLFLPLVNLIFFNDGMAGDLETVEEKRALVDAFFNEVDFGLVACRLSIEVDGRPAVFSTPFVLAQSGPVDYATDPESIAEGYWVMLDPLPSGSHVIHFTGSFCSASDFSLAFEAAPGVPFLVDVTYNLTVK